MLSEKSDSILSRILSEQFPFLILSFKLWESIKVLHYFSKVFIEFSSQSNAVSKTTEKNVSILTEGGLHNHIYWLLSLCEVKSSNVIDTCTCYFKVQFLIFFIAVTEVVLVFLLLTCLSFTHYYASFIFDFKQINVGLS